MVKEVVFCAGCAKGAKKPKKLADQIETCKSVLSREITVGGIIRFTPLNRPDRRIKVGIWSGRASKIISSADAGDPQKEVDTGKPIC